MTRRQYLAEAIRLYRDAPGTPSEPTRRDWAVAGDLYRRGVDLEVLAHAIRLATLRRHASDGQTDIRSLAYYRAVIDALTEEDLDHDYVAYVRDRYQSLKSNHQTAVR